MLEVVQAGSQSLARAVALLRAGRLVAFPTETVYGLACKADDAEAVAKLYRVKARPRENPLIVHVANIEQARELAVFSAPAELLAEKFWPGALTLVLPYREGGGGYGGYGTWRGRGGELPAGVVVKTQDENIGKSIGKTIGKTIALRIPAGEVALALLQRCGFPLAAPSANRSGEVSATEVAHVCQAFSQKENKEGEEEGEEEPALVLAGWESSQAGEKQAGEKQAGEKQAGEKPEKELCQLGIESTIVALLGEGDVPRLLRAGAIETLAIERVLGDVLLAGGVDGVPLAPGGMARHYAPSRPLRLNARTRLAAGEALLGFGDMAERADLSLSESGDLREAASNLYACLHALDHAPFLAIAVAPIPSRGLGEAINDRLLRAASRE